jgi:hypothetical protein
MIWFRSLLLLIFTVIAVYTGVVVARHGLDLLPVFFGDMWKLGWPGQFNLDFLCMLMLSGLWVGWRHGFSWAGVALGICAFLGGSFFLSAYLLVESIRCGGDPHRILLGRHSSTR